MQTFERDILEQYPPAVFQSDEEFCNAVGEIQGEFLAIHPFREGNARTIKLMTNLLAVQSGRPLLVYESIKKGAEQYIEAAKAALIGKDYHPMTQIIQQALSRARD
jgi:cell filamentation protein, protein adenylyltransferase